MTSREPAADLLIDAFGRIRELVERVTDGATAEVLAYRPADGANPVGWLVWHLARVQDDHVAELAGRDQAWVADGWVERFDLELPVGATGYGADATEVAAVDGTPADLLVGYHATVHELTLAYLDGIDAEELARVVDRRWDPPVTASARLVSVIGDCLQHLGQAAYLRGLAGN